MLDDFNGWTVKDSYCILKRFKFSIALFGATLIAISGPLQQGCLAVSTTSTIFFWLSIYLDHDDPPAF